MFIFSQITEYLDYDVVMSVLSDAGFMYSKPLDICAFEEAMNFKLGFVTPLPAQFGLPPIKDNLAEGVVIKPMKNVLVETKKGKKRLIFKRKIDKFSERKPVGPKPTKTPKKSKSLSPINESELLTYEMYALITEQRLINAISKIGMPYGETSEQTWVDIQELMVEDVKSTLQEDNEELWQACSPAARGVVFKEIDDQCSDVVTAYRQKL